MSKISAEALKAGISKIVAEAKAKPKEFVQTVEL